MQISRWCFLGSVLWVTIQNGNVIASSTIQSTDLEIQEVTEAGKMASTANPVFLPELEPPADVDEPGLSWARDTQAPVLAAPPAMGYVTSVDQLSDVQPTDWAFQALQSLIERYGCIAGYGDETFRGDAALTRDEFAVGLNACLDRVSQLLTSSTEGSVSNADLATLQRLQEEFAEPLAVLRGRVDTLEARAADVETNQFSTTTKLVGQSIFAVNAGGFGGDTIVDPTDAVIVTENPNVTAIYRVSLDFNTSFTGTDLLKIRIDTGNDGANDNAAGVLEPNFGSGLDFSVKPPRDETFGIGRLYYTFAPLQDLTVSIGPNIRTTDYVDLNSYAYLSFRDFSTQALINNYILFPLNGPSSGASVAWNPGEGAFTIRALYAAADATNPSDQGILRGTAAFTRLLYPSNGDPATVDLGNRGLFGDTYQGTVELEYAPSANLAIRVQYSGGEVFDRRFDVFGANAELTLAGNIGLFGRYGYGSYNNTAFGDLNPNYWMAGLAVRDLWTQGSVAGLAAGQPFIEDEIGDATQTNFEAFYNFPLNDYLRITPLIQVILDSSNQDANDGIITGTLRTVFLF